jgi:hypothetical protein
MKKKKAAAQDMMAAKVNIARGRLSLGSSPLRRISGIDPINKMIKMGSIEKGATTAPVSEEKSGKEVNGRQIRAMAQRISASLSRFLLNLPVASITIPSIRKC